jgi:hypothetical protein
MCCLNSECWAPNNPAACQGPALWLKCMIARTLPEANWPEDAVPVICLPGVSRQELRAVDTCPKPLQPLAELQYRGVFWSQHNGKDWTCNLIRGTVVPDLLPQQPVVYGL